MFCTLLPGRLQDNRLETRSLKKYLMARDECGRLTFDFNKFFEEIFELAERSRSVNFGHPWENHDWNKDEWYCTSCLTDLMREVLFKWWIRRKIKGITLFLPVLRCSGELTPRSQRAYPPCTCQIARA